MVAILTDVGKSRSLNEDFASYIEKDDYGIYVVADGMGGHNAGEVASRMASVGIVEYVYNHFNDIDKYKLLKSAIKKVNLDIIQKMVRKKLKLMSLYNQNCLLIVLISRPIRL